MSIKVIGAGLGRTGTLSLKNALEELGFSKCYHMVEVLKKPEYGKYWIAASKGQNVDWNEVFEGFQSTVDFPSCVYYKEQLAFYPDAKVILTVRDPEKWYESTYNTIYKAGPSIKQMITVPFILPFSPRRRKLISWFKHIGFIWKVMYEGKFEDKAYAIAKFKAGNLCANFLEYLFRKENHFRKLMTAKLLTKTGEK